MRNIWTIVAPELEGSSEAAGTRRREKDMEGWLTTSEPIGLGVTRSSDEGESAPSSSIIHLSLTSYANISRGLQ